MLVTFGLPIYVKFLPDPCFIRHYLCDYAEIPAFYANIYIFIFHCTGNIRGQVTIVCLQSLTNDCVCAMHWQGGKAGAC